MWRNRDQITLVLNKVVGGQDIRHQSQSLLPLNTTNSFGKLRPVSGTQDKESSAKYGTHSHSRYGALSTQHKLQVNLVGWIHSCLLFLQIEYLGVFLTLDGWSNYSTCQPVILQKVHMQCSRLGMSDCFLFLKLTQQRISNIRAMET